MFLMAIYFSELVHLLPAVPIADIVRVR